MSHLLHTDNLMDSQPITFENVIRFARQRRIRALFVGVTMLAVLAVLQVQQQTSDSRLCELYPNAKLSEGELYRLEVALIQEDLDEFETSTEGKLLVPTSKRLEYMKAIARQDAEPIDYRKLEGTEDATPSIFLPKSARDAITLETRKKKIEKNILRLPYIVEAIFEMDQPSGFTTFQKQQLRASISLATKDTVPLTEEHVKTIKAIIQVAAGVELNDIVMIDLNTGLIHDEPPSKLTDKNICNVASDISKTKRTCENRISEALTMYPEIKATVDISVEPATANLALKQKREMKPTQVSKTGSPSFLLAGANAAVKLDTAPYQIPEADQQEIESPRNMTKLVSISIDVPEQLVNDCIQASHSTLSKNDQETLALNQEVFSSQFKNLKSEISKKIESTLMAIPDLKCDDSIAFNLIPATKTAAVPLDLRLKQIAAENWPSGIVLLVGLFLLVSISRGTDPLPNDTNLQFSSRNRQSGTNSAIDATPSSDSEARLTQLIEKDPDAAARVIESWIRDAA